MEELVVAATDVGQAKGYLRQHGLRTEQPPEDWLFKVHTDGVVIDVLHRSAGRPLADALRDASVREVISVEMPVLSATELLVHKLASLDEHWCDFGWLLPVARALREQVDWDRVRQGTADNDFAAAFLVLTDRLGITG